MTDLDLCNPDSISWTCTELIGYFAPVGVHQLCGQSLYMALTYRKYCVQLVPETAMAALQISVILEVLGQERSALFKRRKELETDWGRKRERTEKLRMKRQ